MLITLLALAVLLPSPAMAQDVNIIINSQQVAFPDQKPYIDDNNRTMVPVRAPMEAIGCTVDWDENKQQAILTKDGVVAVFTIGSSTYTVNDASRTMDTQAVIAGNRTAFPIRFAAEAMGATVGWDAETYTVSITSLQNPTQTGVIEATPEQVAALRTLFDDRWWETNYRISPSVTRSFDAMTPEEKDIAWGLLDTGIIKPGQTFVASKDTTCVQFTGAYTVRGYLTLENGQTHIGLVQGAYENGNYVRVFFYTDDFIGTGADGVPVYEQML